MTHRWIIALLATATALNPIAANANGGFGGRIVREANEARTERRAAEQPRAPRVAPQPSVAPPADAPRFQRNDGGRGRGQRGPAPEAGQPAPAPAADRADRGWNRGGNPDGATNRGNRGGNRDGGNADGGWRGRGGWDRNGQERQGNDGYQPRQPGPPPVVVPTPRADRNDTSNRGGDGRDGRWQERRNDDGGFGRDIIRDARGPRTDRDDRHDRDNRDGRYDRNDRGGRYDNDGRDWRRNDGNRHDRGGYDRDNRYDRNDRYDNNHRWDRRWRDDRRYDWYGHRDRYRNQYRWPTYYSPYRNWGYRRLTIGFSLWPLFYSDQYWINDPWNYRLPDAYGPYRWIRYYDDALLVDVRTGEVIDVIDNFFW